jgi:hypothetical protein
MSKYKLDGAKFETLEELKKTLWELYKDKMSEEDFNKYVDENVEESE